MVNGNYVLYGDRPSSESEIVDDHVQTRTAERKNKRKSSRNANELQRTLNMAQLDNETDSVKYEKTVKEPRLLRYVATTDVEENYVTEKFETYDLKPTEERPRRYAFQKKPRNPTDGSVNYAYSRSSSSCSSPNGNLPTISEHGEQYGTYRVQNLQSPKEDIINGYENKLDKYFYKPKEMKKFSSKVNFEGSHPDSLYRVAPTSGVGVDKMAKVLRIMRWPLALVLVCVALAAFVYFLMPENKYNDMDVINGTYWEPMTAGAHTHENLRAHGPPRPKHRTHTKKPEPMQTHNPGTKTSEIDFYDVENDKNAGFTTMIDSITESSKNRMLPIKPVFPTHIAPEVQYGNERADADKLRTPKVLEEAISSADSTLKPHITQKPEKPLAVYFKDLNGVTTTPTETFTTAETVNENASYDEKTINTYVNYGDKQISPIRNYGDKPTTKKVEISTKSHPAVYKDYRMPVLKAKPLNIKQYLVTEPEIPLEIEEYYEPPLKLDNFTSGHSKLFGISIEDAEKMKSTTQSSLYNTRVSPTLPTWRDGDDATTKKYPINVNYEVPLCRSTRLPLCSEILPYDLAGSPATIAGVEVTSLMSQIGYLVATNCSERVRHFTCALLEPECNPPPYPPKMPCYNLCKAIVDGCDGVIPRELTPAFNCQQYSRTNCVAAKAPCFAREMTCGDGTCIPRDWICDGSQDCPDGEDEATCNFCQRNEYRCKSGGCILRRWLCDGYADCPGGEDETEACEHHEVSEPGEESAGSAPAPVVRRPSRVTVARGGDMRKAGENDNSKELLVTSDSSNAFKRNFTRRPSLSRLSPYTRSTQAPVNVKPDSQEFDFPKTEGKNQESIESTQKPQDYMEEVNIGELGFFEELKKTKKQPVASNNEQKPPIRQKAAEGMAHRVASNPTSTTKLDKSINKLEKVINGAALLRKAQAEEQDMDSPETNGTTIEANDFIPPNVPEAAGSGKRNPGITSAHVSPCPSGELRCVDGRCITLAQLCDGTIDCSDHADEDNCYT